MAGDPSRVICLEGPSAVGKTTLLHALERECGAAIVPELDAGRPPPIGESAEWFAERGAERWRLAREKAAGAPFTAMDGDPFKGLWYNWVYADEGWEQVDAVAPLLRARVERGTLAFPDLSVVLTATESQLRRRRADDATRTRRNFEKHLRLVEPLRRYFSALRAADPPRVLFLDTTDRDALVARVLDAVRSLPPGPPDSARLLDHAAAWLRAHPDAASEPASRGLAG
jgi:hypothetical protein